MMASIISFAFGLISLNSKGKTILVNICVKSDANAAPTAPITGISAVLIITFINAAQPYMYFKYLCFPSEMTHASLATPKYEKAVYHVTTFNTEAAGKKASPYKIPITNLPNKTKQIDTKKQT